MSRKPDVTGEGCVLNHTRDIDGQREHKKQPRTTAVLLPLYFLF